MPAEDYENMKRWYIRQGMDYNEDLKNYEQANTQLDKILDFAKGKARTDLEREKFEKTDFRTAWKTGANTEFTDLEITKENREYLEGTTERIRDVKIVGREIVGEDPREIIIDKEYLTLTKEPLKRELGAKIGTLERHRDRYETAFADLKTHVEVERLPVETWIRRRVSYARFSGFTSSEIEEMKAGVVPEEEKF